jgi:S1-C subfamily serine protease
MDRAAAWFAQRMPTPALLRQLVQRDPRALLRGGAADRGLVNFQEDVTADPFAKRPQTEEDLRLATAVARRLLDTGSMEPLSDREKEALEVYLTLAARPAILVRNGQVVDRVLNWPEIRDADATIRAALPAVGRISAFKDGRRLSRGTGFLVDGEHLLTNNHVVWALVKKPGDPNPATTPGAWFSSPDLYATRIAEANAVWRSDPQARPEYDRRGELGSDVAERSFIREIVSHHRAVDFAVLRLAAELPDVSPLALARSPAVSVDGGKVFLVGYPTSAPEGTAADHVEQLFGEGDAGALGVKRLSPARLGGLSEELGVAHDGSTLGGSSGSPLIDFLTGQVVGIHYRGSELENHAVPLWEHVDDDELAVVGG